MKTKMNSIPKKWTAFAIGLFLIGMGSLVAQSHSYNTDESTIALDGYSPVSYIDENMAQLGKKSFKATYDGLTYFFVNQDQQKKFQSNPKKYIPQYGGWCAYAVSLGYKYRPNPKSFRVVDDKLYLFTVNVEAEFVKAWEKEGKEKHILQGDKNWKTLEKFKSF
ncbi:YHS domain-containing (seleno)protein [Flagellimonas okinawensis]|uniref:YHS domain-containing (Seleno)protein n=1 Tax=Flagellimonas okinawensis TaxID=3031324 RepID=A0ABT5XQT8_9FLAO|nr:YHS domain-containing (seleno)protein [[Muricauda] okinawensis]MDF0708254.1 YHS domain-containing (seleno)protein [[Muricauda] okinawensis]